MALGGPRARTWSVRSHEKMDTAEVRE